MSPRPPGPMSSSLVPISKTFKLDPAPLTREAALHPAHTNNSPCTRKTSPLRSEDLLQLVIQKQLSLHPRLFPGSLPIAVISIPAVLSVRTKHRRKVRSFHPLLPHVLYPVLCVCAYSFSTLILSVNFGKFSFNQLKNLSSSIANIINILILLNRL